MGPLQSTPGPLQSTPVTVNWREQEAGFKWTIQQGKTIKERINNSDATSKTRQWLLIGPSSAGKSSFINSILSLGNERVTYTAPAGQTRGTLTKTCLYYKGSGFIENCNICDTAGVLGQVNAGFNPDDLLKLIKGHIKKGYPFGADKSISTEDKCYVAEPERGNEMNCVVFVFDASQIDETGDDYAEKIRTLLTNAQDIGVPCIAVLTKIDKVSAEVDKDISKIYTCKNVENAVKKIEEIFGIPRMVIFPVVNYVHEQCTEFRKDIVLLLTLEKILHCVADASKQNIHLG